MVRLALLLTLASSVALADPPKFEIKDNQLQLPRPVLFESGKAVLMSSSDVVISYVRDYLEAKASISSLRIEVHSDTGGSESVNQKLTEARALAIAKALTTKGVDCRRLVAVGFGSTKPIADNKTPAGKAQNRRSVFVNAALRGHAIGGQPLDGGGAVAGDPCR